LLNGTDYYEYSELADHADELRVVLRAYRSALPSGGLTVPKPLFQNCLRPIIPCVGLGLIGILALTWAATAAPRSTGNPFRKTPSAATTGYGSTYEPAEHEPVAAEPATRIKMNYMRASWQKVLQDLAEATQTQLVCDKFPKKPYSRFDRRAYSPDEALRIINNEIEPQGFRAMFKGSFLVVIDLPSARTEYPRAVIPAGGAKPAEAGGDSIEQAGGAALEIPAPKPRTTPTPIRTRTQAARVEPTRSPGNLRKRSRTRRQRNPRRPHRTPPRNR
jgi:hypothetical protein